MQCCGKCKILGRPTDRPWLMVGWSVSVLGGPSIRHLLTPWNHSKTIHIDISEYLILHRHTTWFWSWLPMASGNLHRPRQGNKSGKSSVRFHSEMFSAKSKGFIGRQMDHPCKNLVWPGGFMGRIWRPGDRISAALAMSPEWCLPMQCPDKTDQQYKIRRMSSRRILDKQVYLL